MAILTLRPYDGIGPIRLGSTRERVMAWLGQPRISRPREASCWVDHYPSLSIVYDVAERVRSVEVFAPNQVLIDDIPLLERALTTVGRELRARFGAGVVVGDHVIDVRSHGFCVHAEATTIAMVTAYVHGCYLAGPPREAW